MAPYASEGEKMSKARRKSSVAKPALTKRTVERVTAKAITDEVVRVDAEQRGRIADLTQHLGAEQARYSLLYDAHQRLKRQARAVLLGMLTYIVLATVASIVGWC
jgi:chemotaxis protein histidine kinase CheA